MIGDQNETRHMLVWPHPEPNDCQGLQKLILYLTKKTMMS